MRRRILRAVLAAAATALTPLGPAPASADGVVFHNDQCHEFIAGVLAPTESVRPLVPAHYGLRPSTSPGRTLVLIRAARCESKGLDGATEPSTEADVAVAITDPRGPLGAPESFHQYVVTYGSTSQRYVNWLGPARVGSGGTQLLLAPTLTWSFRPLAGLLDPSFEVQAPQPMPSPFTMRAVADAVQPAPTELLATDFWIDGAEGTSVVAVELHDLHPSAAIGTIDVAPGSPLARMLGSEHVIAPMLHTWWPRSVYHRSRCDWQPAPDPLAPARAVCQASS